jgi:VanZ family protein
MRTYQKVASLARDFTTSQGKEPDARGKRGDKKASVAVRRASWRGRLWRYVPLFSWIAFIFFASGDNLSASETSRIVRPLLLWLFPGITEARLLDAHFLVRKAAHLTEYALLALLAARAFLTSSQEMLRRRWITASLCLVVLCALLDEYHQSFLATRTGSIYDSLLDTTGGAIALACVVLVRAFGRRREHGEVLRTDG